MIIKKYFTLIFVLSCLLLECKSIVQKQVTSDKTTLGCASEIDSILNKQVYTKVDSMPEFSGGNIAVIKYFKSNFKIPSKTDDFLASFRFEFVIDVDGRVVGERVSGKKFDQLTPSEIEGLRVLGSMPKWDAGKCNGQTVPVKVTLPLKL